MARPHANYLVPDPPLVPFRPLLLRFPQQKHRGFILANHESASDAMYSRHDWIHILDQWNHRGHGGHDCQCNATLQANSNSALQRSHMRFTRTRTSLQFNVLIACKILQPRGHSHDRNPNPNASNPQGHLNPKASILNLSPIGSPVVLLVKTEY